MLALGACRDRSTPQDAQDKLCTRVAELDGLVSKLAALEPTTANLIQVRVLRIDIESKYKDVQEAAKDAGVGYDALTRAYNDVLRSTNGVNDQTAFEQAAPQMDQAAGEFSEARLQLTMSAGC